MSGSLTFGAAQRNQPLNPTTEPLFYRIAVPAMLVSAIGKGGFAGATANVIMLMVPLPRGMSEAPFCRIITAALLVLGVKLTWDGFLA